MVDSEAHTPERTFSDELRELINNRNMLTQNTKSKVIHDLQKEQLEIDQKRLDMQWKTIKEIINSEQKYLSQLDTALKFFRTPLEDAISDTAANKVFYNIETIMNLSKVLLHKLESDLRPANIAEAFINMAPFFKLYTSYTNDYKRTIFAIQELRRKNQRLHVVITRQETRPEVADRINSLLIVPVQRVPRYRLLLRELLEHTLPNSADHKLVSEALWGVEEVTEHINSQVNQQDNLQRLMQIQQSLAGGKPNIILPGRQLIKEGVLMKVADNEDKGKPRHFVLMTDALMCCKMKAGSLQCTHLVPLRKCKVQLVLGRGVFSIAGFGGNLLLHSKENKAEEWVEAIRLAAAQYGERINTLQKKVSSRPSLHGCITAADDTFEYPSTSTKSVKRKHSEQDVEDNCFPTIQKKIAKLSETSGFFSKQKSIEDADKENNTAQKIVSTTNKGDGYFSSFKKFLSRLNNWF